MSVRDFAQRWQEVQGVLGGYLFARLGNHQQVDDLLQEVALAALQSYASYRSDRSFGAWAMGIAKHKLCDHLRRGTSREIPLDEAQIATLEDLVESDLHRWEQRRRAMRDCVRHLSAPQRALMEAYYHHGHDTRTMAARQGLTVGSIKSRLHRIRAALRRCVERALERTRDAP